MAEPNSTAGGVAIATGAITLSGSILGLQADALLFGLFGGLLWLMHETQAMGKARMALTLFASAVLAGVGAPILMAAALASVDFLARVPAGVLTNACALLVGFGGQKLLPLVLGRVADKVGGPSTSGGER